MQNILRDKDRLWKRGEICCHYRFLERASVTRRRGATAHSSGSSSHTHSLAGVMQLLKELRLMIQARDVQQQGKIMKMWLL